MSVWAHRDVLWWVCGDWLAHREEGEGLPNPIPSSRVSTVSESWVLGGHARPCSPLHPADVPRAPLASQEHAYKGAPGLGLQDRPQKPRKKEGASSIMRKFIRHQGWYVAFPSFLSGNTKGKGACMKGQQFSSLLFFSWIGSV